MKNTKRKVYKVNEVEYVFDHDKFSELCLMMANKKNHKKSSIAFLMYMEEKLNYEVTDSTLKGWIFGNNSPATIDMVEKIASVFNVETSDLLIEIRKEKEMNTNYTGNIDELTREEVKKIYGGFVDIIEGYIDTLGFSLGFSQDSIETNDETNELLGYESKMHELIKEVKKSRVHFSRNVISKLLGLIGRIDMSSDPFNMTVYDYYLKDFGTDEEKKQYLEVRSEYEEFLEGKKTNPISEKMFVELKAMNFYKELDDIFANFLP